MYEVLKIIHMFALMGGGAGMIGNGLLMARVMESDGPPPAMVKRTMKALGMVGLVSILTLWVTGGIMSVQAGYGLESEYVVKLIGATVVLGSVSLMSLHTTQRDSRGEPPNMIWMKRLAKLARGGVLIAVVFAVMAFN